MPICMYVLFLGTAIAPHDIVSAQGLSENMEILSATMWTRPRGTSEAQGKHKVPHR
jgi:hypothetical protein